jgi:hypothetical protein
MNIQFKFREDASEEQRRRVLDRLERDVDQVDRLFPAERDPELETLYVAVLGGDSVPKALRFLRRSKVVEFAEPQEGRRLYLPEELKGRRTIAKP